MEDQFVWWHGGDYTVLDGSRKGLDRRKRIERRGSIAKGIFAVNVQDRRRYFERRQIRERRVEDRTFSTERLAYMTSSMPLGIFLLVIGILFLVLGIAIFQTISTALGLFLFIGGAFVMLIHVHKKNKK